MFDRIRILMSFLPMEIILILTSCNIMSFRPLEVISWSPENEIIDSVDNTVVSICFSKDVDRVKAESAFSLLENGKEIWGKYDWQNAKSFKFVPFHNLVKNARYEIQVSTDCEDLNGNSLGKQFYHRFSTSDDKVRPEVLSASPADRSIVDERQSPVVIDFSEPVDVSSFFDSFSISPDIKGDFSWSNDGSTVTFSPAEKYEYHSDYTVTITKDLADLSYNNLKEDYIFKFSVGKDTDKPYILNAGESGGTLNLTPDNPNDGNITVTSGWEANWKLTIDFSEEVDTDTVNSAVSFSPTVNYSIDSSGKKYTSSVTLNPETRLEYGETYRMIVDANINDREDNTLVPAIFYFTVNGPNTKPPEITHTVFLEDPNAPGVLKELYYGDTISLANYLDSPGSTEGFFDIYISVADISSVDTDELKLMVMNCFDISVTNAAAVFITKGVVIDPKSSGETPFPNPPPAADELVARIFMDISNNSGITGIVEMSLTDEFEDGCGNPIANRWLTRFQKN